MGALVHGFVRGTHPPNHKSLSCINADKMEMLIVSKRKVNQMLLILVRSGIVKAEEHALTIPVLCAGRTCEAEGARKIEDRPLARSSIAHKNTRRSMEQLLD